MLSLVDWLRDLVYRHKTARQFAKFCVVGTINTLVDFSAYIFLTRVFDFWNERLVLAAAVSYCCGMITSFGLNNFWTFRQNRHGMLKRLPKFLPVTFAGLGWNALIIYILLSLDVYDVIAKIFATGCVILWNFSLQKKWTFKE
ncbi:MAG: GtrA family protein [Patescibacteria group bacterium]